MEYQAVPEKYVIQFPARLDRRNFDAKTCALRDRARNAKNMDELIRIAHEFSAILK